MQKIISKADLSHIPLPEVRVSLLLSPNTDVMIGILNTHETEQLLKEEVVGRIGCCDEARKLPIVASENVHLSPDWPFIPDDVDKIGGVTFRILLEEKTGRFERATAEASYFFF